MSPLTRVWVSFAAIGAGLIHVALVVGAPAWAAVLVGMLGLAEFVWGAITFSRDAPPVPRVALVVALVPVLLWVVGLVTRTVPETFAPLSLGVASLFTLFVAAALGVHLRSGPRAGIPGTVRFAVGLVAALVVVVALTLPALGATVVGGGHPGGVESPFDEHGHSG
ncbi:hypothetical protein [Antiquaquibacter soli]|uniref:DUF2568 domain-containing protein n=1 Tax=Antiquaquibacter soli TaxID=3064523 RepID=A0ABT9BR41_9MICO|nr:hypothetical protein [Protaetiibacter sp. WY-16]MDO7883104.1 hypothetical protein [Protaetiibacter sp. WY-16]